MKLKLCILFISLLIFVKCKLIFGITDPKIEKKTTLHKYLLNFGIDTNNCYIFTQEAFDSIQKTPYKPDWPIGFRPIQFKCFDSSGKLISQYSSCEGSYKKLKIFESFPPKNVFKIDSTLNLENDLIMYRTYYGDKIELIQKNKDLIFVVYWGKWLGRFSKKLLKEINNYQKKHSNHKIEIIKINISELKLYNK